MRLALLIVVALMGSAVLAVPAAASTNRSQLRANETLRLGDRLVSPHGRYYSSIEPNGSLSIRTAAGAPYWHTPAVGRDARATLGGSGQLMLQAPGGGVWRAGTKRSGHHDVLTLGDDGVLTLSADGLLVWTNRIGNACPWSAGKLLVIDLSAQFARACRRGQQLRATPVTTGASALGNGTPTGTWRVQAKVRDTVLHPASGGAYPVHFWVPYDGDYGLHDSPWQKFPYGSPKYRRHGSHGCTHFPAAMMAWVFGWARVGWTTVTIHA